MWNLLPEEKLSLQLNKNKKTITLKAKRQTIESRLDLLLTFFGPPIAAACAPAKTPPVMFAPVTPQASHMKPVDIRLMLQKGAENGDF